MTFAAIEWKKGGDWFFGGSLEEDSNSGPVCLGSTGESHRIRRGKCGCTSGHELPSSEKGGGRSK